MDIGSPEQIAVADKAINKIDDRDITSFFKLCFYVCVASQVHPRYVCGRHGMVIY